ncbi:VOC family protein [Acetobacteraceae bacterium H6797]|nr:VOC family protein [Acetobacteraceae bacterium H6797]
MPGPTPHLSVPDVARAAQFYTEVLGAELLERLVEPGGDRIIFCALRFDSGLLYLTESRRQGGISPAGLVLHLSVDDAEATYKRALGAGAEAVQEPTDAGWGERHGRFRDPVGILWAVSQPVDFSLNRKAPSASPSPA